jgi:hypothetical protein
LLQLMSIGERQVLDLWRLIPVSGQTLGYGNLTKNLLS